MDIRYLLKGLVCTRFSRLICLVTLVEIGCGWCPVAYYVLMLSWIPTWWILIGRSVLINDDQGTRATLLLQRLTSTGMTGYPMAFAACWSSPDLSIQGHGSKWSDFQLCLFSFTALRDRCKCTTDLDAQAYTSPAASHLFIIPCLTSPSLSYPLFPSGPALLCLSALSFWNVNKSDSGGCWNDRISLSAGSVVTSPSPVELFCTPFSPSLCQLLLCRFVTQLTGSLELCSLFHPTISYHF